MIASRSVQLPLTISSSAAVSTVMVVKIVADFAEAESTVQSRGSDSMNSASNRRINDAVNDMAGCVALILQYSFALNGRP